MTAPTPDIPAVTTVLIRCSETLAWLWREINAIRFEKVH
jgi:hypothetical protein